VFEKKVELFVPFKDLIFLKAKNFNVERTKKKRVVFERFSSFFEFLLLSKKSSFATFFETRQKLALILQDLLAKKLEKTFGKKKNKWKNKNNAPVQKLSVICHPEHGFKMLQRTKSSTYYFLESFPV
jgi:hypothetical protein